MEVGFGTLLERGDGATPTEAFTAVAEVVNIDMPLAKDAIEGTHQQSPGRWRQFKPGLISGEITFEGNYLPGNATHDSATGLMADFRSHVIKNYRISFVSGEKWVLPSFLRDFNPSAPVDDKLGMAGTLQIAEEPTFEEAP
jgi:hypothetical protein